MAEIVSDYERYVERYARNNGITPAEAREHALVKSAKEYYEEESKEDGKEKV